MKNKIHLMICGALLLPAALYAAEAHRDYPAQKIAEHTYVIHGPLTMPSVENQGFMNNPGFVVTKNAVVIIDAGSSVQSGRMVLRQIAKLTDKPVTHVFTTHIHGDHWLGNDAIIEKYPNAKLLAHPNMIQKAIESEADVWVNMMDKLTEGFTKGTKAVIPTIAIKDGESIKIDGMTYRYHAPKDAHSRTDVMFEVVEDSVVFLGDNVTYKRIPRMDDGTFKGTINACDVAIKIGAKTYVPGHGPTGDVKVVKSFKNYLDIIFKQSKKYYEEDLSDFEMKPKIAPLLEEYKTWPGFDENFGKSISLAILEIEQSDF